MKKAILIVNMGAPESETEMRQFLFNMFADKFILPLPWILRRFLAKRISSKRYKSSWEKYELIGGSPLKQFSRDCCTEVTKAFADYEVVEAYSYSKPSIRRRIKELGKKSVTDLVVFPLYPNYSSATTESIRFDCDKALKRFPKMKMFFIEEFGAEIEFISFWKELIEKQVDFELDDNAVLVGSFHSLPDKIAEKCGYSESCNLIVESVAKALGIDCRIAFQSQIRDHGWLGPKVKDVMDSVADKNVVLCSMSFVCENLETMYDFDYELIPELNHQKSISRIKLPNASEGFANVITRILKREIK